MGTHWGIVHIMDFEGNENQKFQAHQATVNDLSVDLDGEYIASASDDGRNAQSQTGCLKALHNVYTIPNVSLVYCTNRQGCYQWPLCERKPRLQLQASG